MEVNKRSDVDLKQKLADIALSALVNGGLIKEEDFNGVKVEFGYVFQKTDGQIEALYRLTFVNGAVHYFAAQNGQVMHIMLDDVMFNDTIEKMRGFHDCLKSDAVSAQTPNMTLTQTQAPVQAPASAQDPSETEAQRVRRTNNNELLKSQNISISENLACRYNDETVKLKSLEDVCRRAVACIVTIQIACDIRNNYYEQSKAYFLPILNKFGAQNSLNSKERRIIDGTYTEQDLIDMDWAYEAYWALCWCLGLVNDITDASNTCDCETAVSFVVDSPSLEDFQLNCFLRSNKDILDMHDLYYRYNWAINDQHANPSASIGNLDPSIVLERRRGLEWLLSEEEDWYNLDLSA